MHIETEHSSPRQALLTGLAPPLWTGNAREQSGGAPKQPVEAEVHVVVGTLVNGNGRVTVILAVVPAAIEEALTASEDPSPTKSLSSTPSRLSAMMNLVSSGASAVVSAATNNAISHAAASAVGLGRARSAQVPMSPQAASTALVSVRLDVTETGILEVVLTAHQEDSQPESPAEQGPKADGLSSSCLPATSPVASDKAGGNGSEALLGTGTGRKPPALRQHLASFTGAFLHPHSPAEGAPVEEGGMAASVARDDALLMQTGLNVPFDQEEQQLIQQGHEVADCVEVSAFSALRMQLEPTLPHTEPLCASGAGEGSAGEGHGG